MRLDDAVDCHDGTPQVSWRTKKGNICSNSMTEFEGAASECFRCLRLAMYDIEAVDPPDVPDLRMSTCIQEQLRLFLWDLVGCSNPLCHRHMNHKRSQGIESSRSYLLVPYK